MITRYLTAILLGMLVGIVLLEGFLAAVGFFFPTPISDLPKSSAGVLSTSQLLTLSLFWILASSASALVATGHSDSQSAGGLCALLWTIPITLTIGLKHDSPGLLAIPVSIAVIAWLVSVRLTEVNQS